jgi:alpha-tubulin suppressor-like RCC1 family protein
MSNVSPLVFSPALDNQGIIDLGAGYRHACALFSSGAVACWGRNVEGQLGNEVTSSAYIGDDPNEVAAIVPIAFKASLASLPVVQVGAGNDYSCGIGFCSRAFFLLFFFFFATQK